jgi:hypothetical protein
LFGPIPGGLGISVVFVGALLAATTGIVGATVIAMGLISLPAMLRNNYSKSLACGTICASGTLGQIIPLPSGETSSPRSTSSPDNVDFVEVDRDLDDAPTDGQITVETRIDVIRMVDHRNTKSEDGSQQVDASEEQQPMDEALNFLLRQLRDSQQRKAA